MTRSGIKQGLAISAVSALSIVGLPAAAHAATPTYNVTQSATSVSTGETVNITISSPDASATDVATATGTETFPAGAGGVVPAPVPVVVTPVAPSPTNAQTVKTTDDNQGETLTFTAPATPGTVSVTFVDGNNTTHIVTVAVGGGKVGAAAVSAVKANNTSFSLYQGDLAGTNLSVRPVDAQGFGVSGATVLVSVDGAAPTAYGTSVAGTYDISNALPALAVGSHTLKLWVDEANNGDTANKLDADEPNATVTVNVAANPASLSTGATAGTFVGVGGTDTGANDNDYLVGKATTAGAKLQVLDNSATPKAIAGAKVRFDVYAGNPATTGQYQLSLFGTSDANGNISVSAPLTADQTKALAAAGGLYASAYVSQSSNKGVGTLIGTQRVAEFSAAAYNAVLAGGATKLQATKGSTVTVNIVEKDQFGNPAVGHVFTVAGGAGANAAPGAPGDRLAPTNAQGQTSYTYTDKVGALGTDAFTFHDLGNGSSDPVDASDLAVNVQYVNSVTPGAVVDNGTAFSDAGQTYTVDADNSRAYSVVVTDGAAAPTVLANQKVTFTVDNGFLVTKAGDKGTAKSVDVVTDANGVATVYAGSTKAGKQTVTAVAGAAKALSSKADTFEADNFYHLNITPSGDILTNSTGKVTISAVDRFGNGVAGEWFDVSQSGAGSLPNGTSADQYRTGVDGTVSVSIAGGASAGTGSLVVTNDNWGNNPVTKDDEATVTPYAGNQTVTYTVKPVTIVVPPVTTPAGPSAFEKKLAQDQAKLAKAKKALKHAKGHRKAHLKMVVKNLKKAIKIDKKAIAAGK